MKVLKITLFCAFSASLLVNAVVCVAGGFWLSERMRPLPVNPPYMKKLIKELSLNSAGKWRVIEHDKNRIIVEYRLPIYDIARYKLSKNDFRLSEKLEIESGPFALSFDGCDIYARTGDGMEYECMRFRDLTPSDDCATSR